MKTNDIGARVSTTRTRRQRGSTLVESALCLMAFMLVLFGIMEFSFAVYAYNFVADAARDGARWASVRGSASSAPATATTVSDFVKSRVVGMNRANLRVTSTWTPDNKPGSAVQVRVEYDTPMFINLAMNHPLTVTSTSRIIIMR